MKRKALFILVSLLFCLNLGAVLADDDGHDRKYRKHDRRYLSPVENPTYQEQCGACHFAYQPALLPSGSWRKIMARLEDHFGTDVELDDEDKKIIALYLEANAAEDSWSRQAVKILRSLRGETPLRITEIPYIRHEHEDDDIPAGAFERESVGSMSNCIACHTTADKGIYDDDNVRIPK